LLLAGAPPVHPGNNPTIGPEIDWQRLGDEGSVTIYCRPRIGTGVKEFKGVGLIDAPPAVVEKAIEDVKDYASFLPYVVEARVISQSGNETVAYERLSLPFVSNRDYTVRIEHGPIIFPSGETGYRQTWSTANELGPDERRGVVRVKINEGSWLLEPAGADGQSTQATYQIYTNAGGFMPAFLDNRASELAIQKLFEALRKRLQDVGGNR
jgi:hypothetical protein